MSKLLVSGVALSLAAALLIGCADDVETALPCETARLIVPWSPGGGTAVIFGIFEQQIRDSGAEIPIQVVTMPGQGGALGAQAAHDAAPDGCTLFAIHQHLVVNYINGVTEFSWDGFEPVAMLTDTPEIVGAGGHKGYESFDDMLADARANPGGLPTGVSLGATSHFFWIMLGSLTGTDYQYVPYQGGTAGRITGLLNGEIDLGLINMAAARTQRDDGKLLALAIAADERSDLVPDVPTLKELGVDMTYSLTRGIMAPLGTPPEAIDYWAEVFKAAAENETFIEEQKARGTAVMFLGPDDYRAWWAETAQGFLDAAEALKIGRFE